MGILTQFTCSITCTCHPLLQDVHFLCNHFFEVHIRDMLRESNMCADFAVNKYSRLGVKNVWQENFPQRLIELEMKNVSRFYYDKL